LGGAASVRHATGDTLDTQSSDAPTTREHVVNMLHPNERRQCLTPRVLK
jgi:hypothetical protein